METKQILETIRMVEEENLDIRTITMGISLLDCIDASTEKTCQNIYNKITSKAKNLVKVGDEIASEFGIPIINKRISVTPIAIVASASGGQDCVAFARVLDKAAKAVGINFIGGYSALVEKGYQGADLSLIQSIPEALAETEFVCSSVNIGSTRAGINMDAVKLMGETIKQTAEFDRIADFFIFSGDDPHRRCFMIDDTDRSFISDHRRNRLRWYISWDRDHVQTH